MNLSNHKPSRGRKGHSHLLEKEKQPITHNKSLGGLRMPLIKWREAYSVDVAQFDKEHQQLVELINRMFVIVRDKDDIATISDSVARLIDYTEFHFVSEETAMEKAGFPGLEEHRRKHASLVEEITNFQQRLLTDGQSVGVEFYQFLREWLLVHIMEEDKQYARYMTP